MCNVSYRRIVLLESLCTPHFTPLRGEDRNGYSRQFARSSTSEQTWGFVSYCKRKFGKYQRGTCVTCFSVRRKGNKASRKRQRKVALSNPCLFAGWKAEWQEGCQAKQCGNDSGCF